MNVEMNDPTNHKVYCYVTEEYFYKGIQRAKLEKLYADEHGRIDLNKLGQLMWETFADGRYIILPDISLSTKERVMEFIKSLDEAKEIVNDIAKTISEEELSKEFNRISKDAESYKKAISKEAIEAVAEKILEAKPKRKSRARPKIEILESGDKTDDLKDCDEEEIARQ